MKIIRTIVYTTISIYLLLHIVNSIVPGRNAWEKHQMVYPRYPILVAHRGGRGIYAENTIEAMRISYNKYHVDLLECDVQITNDDHFVLLHDFWLNRTTNVTGRVIDYSLKELKSIDAGYWFTEDGVTYPLRGKGIAMTQLEEILDEFYQKDVRISIELKDKTKHSVDKLIEVLQKYPGINKQVCIDCSYHPMQEYFRSKVGHTYCTENDEIEGLQMGASSLLGLSRLFYYLFPNNVEYFFAPYMSHLGFDILTDRFFYTLQEEMDVPFMYFTVNDEFEIARALGLGAKGILTDRPDIAHKVFTALNLRNVTVDNDPKYDHYHVKSPRTSWEFSSPTMKAVEFIGGNVPRPVISIVIISIPVTLVVLFIAMISALLSLCSPKPKKA